MRGLKRRERMAPKVGFIIGHLAQHDLKALEIIQNYCTKDYQNTVERRDRTLVERRKGAKEGRE